MCNSHVSSGMQSENIVAFQSHRHHCRHSCDCPFAATTTHIENLKLSLIVLYTLKLLVCCIWGHRLFSGQCRVECVVIVALRLSPEISPLKGAPHKRSEALQAFAAWGCGSIPAESLGLKLTQFKPVIPELVAFVDVSTGHRLPTAFQSLNRKLHTLGPTPILNLVEHPHPYVPYVPQGGFRGLPKPRWCAEP